MRFLIARLATGFLFMMAAWPFASAAAPLIFWQAERAGSTVYLFGSVHVCDRECYPTSQTVLSRLDDSKLLALELDPGNPEVQQRLMAAARLPAGQTLKDVLPYADWKRLESGLAGLGLSLKGLQEFRPWMVSLIVSLQIAQRVGLDMMHGVDIAFLDRRRQLGLPYVELETISRQLKVLEAGSPAEQAGDLMKVLESATGGHLEAALLGLVSAWKRGDAEGLQQLIRNELEEDSTRDLVLLQRRNAEMVQRVIELSDTHSSVFVVVGAAHMIGRTGMPTLLAEAGFTLRQLHDGE